LDVLQHIDGADGERSAEVTTDAERLHDLEFPAQPAHQFERGLDLVSWCLGLHGETDLVINHGVLPSVAAASLPPVVQEPNDSPWATLDRGLTFSSPAPNSSRTRGIVEPATGRPDALSVRGLRLGHRPARVAARDERRAGGAAGVRSPRVPAPTPRA